MNMSSFRNIIFDFCGVLFTHNPGQNNKLTPLKGGIGILEDLYTRRDQLGYRFFGCTNLSQHSIEQLKEDYPQIMGYFVDILTPERSGYKKPHPQMYLFLLALYELDPLKTIVLDDSYANIETAHGLGLYGVLVENIQETRAELSRLGML